MAINPDHDRWLRNQCNKLKYGRCSMRACLYRGGYRGEGSDLLFVERGIATCEPYEIHRQLERGERDEPAED